MGEIIYESGNKSVEWLRYNFKVLKELDIVEDELYVASVFLENYNKGLIICMYPNITLGLINKVSEKYNCKRILISNSLDPFEIDKDLDEVGNKIVIFIEEDISKIDYKKTVSDNLRWLLSYTSTV